MVVAGELIRRGMAGAHQNEFCLWAAPLAQSPSQRAASGAWHMQVDQNRGRSDMVVGQPEQSLVT